MIQKIKLGSIIQQIRGVSYKPIDVKSAGDSDAIALLRANNIQDSGLNYEDLIYVDRRKVNNNQIIRKGDIIICASSGSKNLVGKAAIADRDLPYTFGAFCKVVRVTAMDAAFIGQFFQSTRYRHEISIASTGANINNIRNEHIDNILIPIYSNAKQNEIVQKLRHIDVLMNIRRKQLALIDQLVKSRFVELFGDPLNNTKGWLKLPITEVCSAIFGGGTPSKSHPEYFTGSIPWVSPKDMKLSVIRDSVDHITEDAIAHSSTSLVPANSVLMVIRSGILKHTLSVAINSVPVAINQDMKAFVPSEIISTAFLVNYFKAIESDVLSGVRSVTADNIDFKAFRKRTIIVPPLELQNQFADFVAQVDKSKYCSQKFAALCSELIKIYEQEWMSCQTLRF